MLFKLKQTTISLVNPSKQFPVRVGVVGRSYGRYNVSFYSTITTNSSEDAALAVVGLPEGEKKKSKKGMKKEEKLPQLPKPNYGEYYESNHPLNKFFDNPETRSGIIGQAWTVAQLRRKGFIDLQRLYMVLLMERNKLLSEKYRAKQSGTKLFAPQRFSLVRQSIARLLTVVNERSRKRAEVRENLRMPSLVGMKTNLLDADVEKKDEDNKIQSS